MMPEQEQFFNSFYKEHFNKLVVHAYRFTKDWHLAKDVVQDSFGKLLDQNKMAELLASENRVGWMKNMVRNTAWNAVRSRNRQIKWLISYEELHGEPSSVDHYPIEDDDTLERSIRRLKKDELLLLRKIALDKVSYVEVAEELGISMWACYKRVQKIRNKLRDELEKER